MKVLLIHNSYTQYGGEDAVFAAEQALLRSRGVQTKIYLVSNEVISSTIKKLITAFGAIFSFGQYFAVRKMLRNYRPDVVHVHNFFPLISPAVFFACKHESAPVVLTLHNYRIVCPTALLMHKGVATERSLEEGPWWALKFRIYRNSFFGTFVVCLMIDIHKRIGTWRHCVDKFIVLSNFAKSRFSKAGLPSIRLSIKSNFVDFEKSAHRERSGFLFVGRLSEEKGIATLLKSVQLLTQKAENPVISIGGGGPLLSDVLSLPEVCYLGTLDAAQVNEQMLQSLALLLPSVWYEGFPMVLVEAYANGLPVIGSRIGALAELIDDGVTGLLFEPGNAEDLAAKVLWAQKNPERMVQMGLSARKRYEERYTPQRNFEQLMKIYAEAIDSHRAHDA